MYASHDEKKGLCQFLCGGDNALNDAIIVSLQEIYEYYSSVSAPADILWGYYSEQKSPTDKMSYL